MALAAGLPDAKNGLSFHLLGADCKDALDSIVIYRDKGSDKWKTLFKPSGFTRTDGQKVSSEELKKLMIVPGDGTVSRRSLEASTQAEIAKVESILQPATSKFVCEEHDRLQTNAEVQDYIMSLLTGRALTAKPDVPATKPAKQ